MIHPKKRSQGAVIELFQRKLYSKISSYPCLFIFIFAVVDLGYQDDGASFSGSLVHLAEDVLEGKAEGAHDNETPVRENGK